MTVNQTPTPLATAVICHYNPTLNAYLRHLVCLCVASLQKIPDEALQIFVCDGSPRPDPFVAESLAIYDNVRYLHAGRQLSFGETYNLGIQAAETPYVVLLANDVLISAKQVRRLVKELRGDVTCAVPYLNRADYATQISRRWRVPRRSYPASMTINVNAFVREALAAIGNVPEALTGCYNDAVIFHRLRQRGQRIALVNVGEVDHLRAITRRIATNLACAQDLAQAAALEPALFAGVQPQSRNGWARMYANASQRRLPGLLWRLLSLLPWKLSEQHGLGYLVAWLEPYLSMR
ncbi:MAG: glycosyltransferase family 2 protein [Ardenticatenaceae bacterium]|nr:glycosyltransferase family 2 protein [Anaerolineales bacterium]MCB8919871.1 glycosyltransferase family 2 protein [Ardenticatenaceae bacterium]